MIRDRPSALRSIAVISRGYAATPPLRSPRRPAPPWPDWRGSVSVPRSGGGMIRSTILTLAALLPLLAAGSAGATAPPASDMPGPPTRRSRRPWRRRRTPIRSPARCAPSSTRLPTDGSAQELKERAVLSDFYAARRDAPMWLSEAGLTDNGAALGAEILNAGDWGLEARTSRCRPSRRRRNSTPSRSATPTSRSRSRFSSMPATRAAAASSTRRSC